MNTPSPTHPTADPAPRPQGAGESAAGGAESFVQPAPAVPNMTVLHIQLLHRMALASADLAESLQKQAKDRIDREEHGQAPPVRGADPALVFTQVVRCLRHCVALAQHLEQGGTFAGTKAAAGKAGKREEPAPPAPPVPQDPKEAAKATILGLLETRFKANKDLKDPQGELDAYRGQFEDPEVYDALGEEPHEHVISLILHKLYFSDGRSGWRETASPPGEVPETPEEAARKAEEQERYETARDAIVAAATEVIMTDPRPGHGTGRGRLVRLEKWVKRSAMRARIGREPNEGIVREILTGMGLPPLDPAAPPPAANGHDPP